MKICFLIHRSTPLAAAENAVYLANDAGQIGYETGLAFIDTLISRNGDIRAMATKLHAPLTAKTDLAAVDAHETSLLGYDAVWVLSLGRRESFLDKIQMLKLLSSRIRVVNSPEALLFMHSKMSLAEAGSMVRYPETHISADADNLWHIIKDSGESWILKPLAESMGRSVLMLSPGDTNARALLQSLTADGSRYCMLQRYLPEVREGEKRVLLAGGEVVGQYFRKATKDHRGNLHQGGEASACDLLPEERAACVLIAKYLVDKGAYFAGLDLAWPWLIEWNVVSPGGLATIDRLGGGNLAKSVINRVLPSSQTS